MFSKSIVLSSLILLAGCAPSKSPISVAAPLKISESFSLAPAAENTAPTIVTKAESLYPSENQTRLRINKASLEKEFLWHAQLVTQFSTPQFSGLKSRVVAFRLRGDTLYMIEATQGHAVTTDLKQTLILASFPVTLQNDTLVEFDFNSGMSDVYTANDWRASDLGGRAYEAEGEFTSISVKTSYIDSARINSKNQLVIVQHLRAVTSPLGLGNMNISLETRHYISPYAANENYKPVLTTNFERMGFFEVAPQLEHNDGATNVYATRFDPARDKIITYAISANTPAAYREAIREGILYWNRAFGYEKIKVIDAPANASAPDSEYNIVQWVPWDGAGGAYADAQMDPRSGEIRHAQVFMTSAFAFSSINRARTLLRKLETTPAPSKYISIAGLKHSTLCNHSGENEQLKHVLSEIVILDLKEEKILEISRDYVREVVAHEVGHTLGLRHNFAGNLSATVDALAIDDLFKKYLKSSELPEDVTFTSSVMEYQNFASATMSGRQLVKTGAPAFTYDKAAIDTLYNNVVLQNDKIPTFCTDSHANKFFDCVRWDQGSSPLADAIHSERTAIEGTPRALIELFIRAKTPAFGLPVKTAEEVELQPETAAMSLLSNRTLIVNLLSTATQSLHIQRSYTKVDGMNRLAVTDKTLETSAEEITRLGGLKSLLALPSAALAANWTEQFNQLIDSPLYRDGIGYNGESYKFTDAEVTSIKKIAELYFNKIQEALAFADVTSLSAHAGTLSDIPAADEYAEVISTRMLEYLLSESGQTLRARVTFGENKTAMVVLPIYKYDKKVRLAAAKMLVARTSVAPDWGLALHNSVKSTFKTKVKSLLMDNDIGTIRPEKNSREVAKWVLENKAIISAMATRD